MRTTCYHYVKNFLILVVGKFSSMINSVFDIGLRHTVVIDINISCFGPQVATMTYENTFGQGSESSTAPNVKNVEEEYWRLVTHGADHTCVNSAAIDTGEEGYGFTKNKNEPYGKHPWNPKVSLPTSTPTVTIFLADVGIASPVLIETNFTLIHIPLKAAQKA